jgi:hypothetical protein
MQGLTFNPTHSLFKLVYMSYKDFDQGEQITLGLPSLITRV